MGLGGGVKTSTISKLLERGGLAYFGLPRFCPRQGKITETFNKLSKQAKKIKKQKQPIISLSLLFIYNVVFQI